MNRQTGIVVGALSVAVVVLGVVAITLLFRPPQVVVSVPGAPSFVAAESPRNAGIDLLHMWTKTATDLKASIQSLRANGNQKAVDDAMKVLADTEKEIARIRAELGLKPGDPIPAE